jgi:hypothetical protein
MFGTLFVTLALLTLVFQDVSAGREGGCQKLYGITASTKEGLRYGFIDCNGKVIIEPKFLSIEDFSDGIAVVRMKREVIDPKEDDRADVDLIDGIVDTNGSLIVPPNTHILSSFSEGLALAKVKSKFAYIDKTGNVAIPIPDKFKISDIDYSPPGEYHFYEGVAGLRAEGGGIYLINKQGNIIFNKEPFHRYDEYGLAIIDIDGKEALVDRQGKYIFGPQDNEINGSEGVYFIVPRSKNEKYKFINIKGDVLYERFFEEVGLFSEGFVKVKLNGKWGYMDKSGKLRIPLEFEDARDFAECLAAVKVKNRWGFIGNNGTFVISPQFKFARDFDCGLVYVQGNKVDGYIDKSGRWVWKENKPVA